MRVGKKTNVVIEKKTRSCVVRLEKVPQNSSASSPTLEESELKHTSNIRLSLTTMGATPKGRKVATIQQEEKTSRGPIKKRPVENSGGSNPQTPQQKLSSTTANSMSSVRSNQKMKIIPRSNKAKAVATPIRDETPPPTVAAGRSRRAIKPNPKYASEDLVTPKVVRNVALGSSGTRGGTSGQSAGDGGKYRKMSSSSDDFYNRNSEDDFENDINEADDDEDEDLQADKAYQANEKEDQDSDFSDVEEVPTRTARPRGRPRKQNQEPTVTSTQQSTAKLSTPTPVSIIKRTTATSATNLRSAPSQLQQIRRSLASANAQRNHQLISGTGTAQKRKFDDTQDLSDNESSYTITRKQMLLTSTSGVKLKVPVKDNKLTTTSSTPLTNKSRALGMQKITATSTPQQTLNGGNKMNSTRKIIEIPAQKSASELNTKTAMRSLPSRQATATETYVNNKSITSNTAAQQTPTTHAKMFVGKTAASSNKVRSRSPKPTATQKDTQSNKTTTVQSSAASSTQNAPKKLPTLNSNRPGVDKTKSLSSVKSSTNNTTSSSNTNTTTSVNHTKALNTKTKSSSQSTAASLAKTLTSEKSSDTQEDSPNSTMDDFETMPTFTIVNVNDIINKKGDVLITKSKSNNKPTVIEFSESISLDDDDDDDDEEESDDRVALPLPVAATKATKSLKLPTTSYKKEFENKKSPLARSNESLRKTLTPSQPNSSLSSSTSTTAPQILNHKLGLRNKRVTPKTTTTLTLTPPDKPAPRILNSMVAKKTQPVKPMIANLDDSADESFPLSLDEDEEEETEDEVESKTISKTLMTEKGKDHHTSLDVDTEDTESQNTEEDDSMIQQASAALTPKLNALSTQRKRKAAPAPIVVSSNKKRLTPAAAKENSLAATNQQVNDSKTTTTAMPQRKNADKVVISKQGDKIIKKITCFETWYVINMPLEPKRHSVMKNQLEMPLIRLANNATSIELPTDLWSCKVTLYELTATTLAKSTLVTYTGDLSDHNINEEDRAKYQPSCVMFRRSVDTRISSRMPYDRAVIFKNKTFYTNIEGKNVRLVGAPSIINSEKEIEILLEVVDNLTLQSDFVEHVSIVQ